MPTFSSKLINRSAKTFLLGGLAVATGHSFANSPDVRIYEQDGKRCIASNGVPNHPIGQFPNSGNPNSFRVQNQKFCFDANPGKRSRATEGTPIVGVALNGIAIRPGTADWYDPSSPRGFSRDRSSGWNLEGMGSAQTLGMDRYNAHVDNRGVYHYHGIPVGLLDKVNSTHVGYAADGFEIHYAGKNAVSSYRLKSGTRPSAPGGKYDGKYIQDWEFKKGSGNLDKCNGGVMNGKYVYFATDTFPFYPRCHWGTVSADFNQPGGAGGNQPRQNRGRGGLAAAAKELGVSEQALAQAVGPPPPNVKRAARILGISEARLHQVLRKHRPK